MAEVNRLKMIILESSQTDQELLEEALQCTAAPDVGCQSSTTVFIDEVIRQVTTK
jgi:hypothetical protein